MNKLDYWIEAVEYALEEIDKIGVFTKNEIETIAETLIISGEQESMAFGTESIPNPLLTEMENLKNSHKREIKEFEIREKIYQRDIAKCIANRDEIYVSGNDVHIENGDVIIRR